MKLFEPFYTMKMVIFRRFNSRNGLYKQVLARRSQRLVKSTRVYVKLCNFYIWLFAWEGREKTISLKHIFVSLESLTPKVASNALNQRKKIILVILKILVILLIIKFNFNNQTSIAFNKDFVIWSCYSKDMSKRTTGSLSS